MGVGGGSILKVRAPFRIVNWLHQNWKARYILTSIDPHELKLTHLTPKSCHLKRRAVPPTETVLKSKIDTDILLKKVVLGLLDTWYFEFHSLLAPLTSILLNIPYLAHTRKDEKYLVWNRRLWVLPATINFCCSVVSRRGKNMFHWERVIDSSILIFSVNAHDSLDAP